MDRTLGIYVSSDEHLDSLIALTKAAQGKGVRVIIFFTHIGTRLCTNPRMQELEAIAEMTLCKVGFESQDLEKPKKVFEERDFSSQTRHSELIHDCDRYLTF